MPIFFNIPDNVGHLPVAPAPKILEGSYAIKEYVIQVLSVDEDKGLINMIITHQGRAVYFGHSFAPADGIDLFESFPYPDQLADLLSGKYIYPPKLLPVSALHEFLTTLSDAPNTAHRVSINGNLVTSSILQGNKVGFTTTVMGHSNVQLTFDADAELKPATNENNFVAHNAVGTNIISVWTEKVVTTSDLYALLKV